MIRLGCLACDTTEADGVAAIPPGWTWVDKYPGTSIADWETHTGYCPNCSPDPPLDQWGPQVAERIELEGLHREVKRLEQLTDSQAQTIADLERSVADLEEFANKTGRFVKTLAHMLKEWSDRNVGPVPQERRGY